MLRVAAAEKVTGIMVTHSVYCTAKPGAEWYNGYEWGEQSSENVGSFWSYRTYKRETRRVSVIIISLSLSLSYLVPHRQQDFVRQRCAARLAIDGLRQEGIVSVAKQTDSAGNLSLGLVVKAVGGERERT
jgi:hypothetical protein